MKRLLLVLLASFTAASCVFGPRMENLNFSRSPRGAMVEVQRQGSAGLSGELLAATESGLVVLSGRRMVTVPFTDIREAKFPELGAKSWRLRGNTPPGEDLEFLRRISHFPQGITPEIQAQLNTLYPG